jgi:hypothetical protein
VDLLGRIDLLGKANMAVQPARWLFENQVAITTANAANVESSWFDDSSKQG